MSSILKALKKLEDENRDSGGQKPGEGKMMKQVVGRRTKRTITLKRSNILIIICFLVAVAIGIVWLGSRESPQKVKSVADKLQNDKAKKPERLNKKAEARPGAAQSTKLPGKAKTGPLKGLKELSLPPGKPVKKDSIPEIKQNQIKVVATDTPREEQEKSKLPELLLKGILWSGLSERRVAIINGRYLKEGEKIKGATIVKIGKNTVTLELGTETWVLKKL